MKQIIFFITAVSLTLFSCSKQNLIDSTHNTLEGNWRMIAVKDNSSGFATIKPSDVQNNVDLTFTAMGTASGIFYGHTPVNDISESQYSTGANHLLTIPFLSMTKVEENSWGKKFVDNILNAQNYSFESDGNLVIMTTNKTLIFQRR